jgi:hypothetical protein
MNIVCGLRKSMAKVDYRLSIANAYEHTNT